MMGMDNQTTSSTQGYVPNNSEPMQNGSDQPVSTSEGVQIYSENLPKKIFIRTESVRNDAEQVINDEKLQTEPGRKESESIPITAEVGQNNTELILNESEPVHPTAPEPYRTAPVCSERHEGFTITVREAARIFEEAGVPRTERAITNWCNRNARGITRLECCYNEEERKYYISPASIERVIKEERRKFQYVEYKSGGIFSSDAEGLSEQLRNDRFGEGEREERTQATPSTERPERERETREPERSEQQREHPPTPEAERLAEDEHARLKELQMENYELRVQLAGQKYLVQQFDSLVAGERDRHEKEKLALVDRLTDARYQVGSLEQKLLQIEAPKGPVRDAETANDSEHLRRPGASSQEAQWRQSV